jgi:hypothetical protein
LVGRAHKLGDHRKLKNEEGNTATDANHKELSTSNTVDKQSRSGISKDRNRWICIV